MDNNTIKNWKLKEIAEEVLIVENNSISFIEKTLNKLKIEQSFSEYFHNEESYINWEKMQYHYKFFFDIEGWEEKIKRLLEESQLKNSLKLIITYGVNEPAVKIPTKVFFEDWEGFFASTQWQTLIFSEDFNLIMEVTRDYYIHSNFRIINK